MRALLRIGIVSGEYPPAVGGVGDQAARLAGELASRGHRVQVLTSIPPAGHGPGEPLDPPGWARPEVLRLVPRWDWRLPGLLRRQASAGGWDVLHLQYQPGAYNLHGAITLAPSLLRRRPGAPAVVTTFHDLRVPYLFPKAGRLRQLAVRQLARGSQGIIAAAGADVARLRDWTGGVQPPPAVRQIPLGNALDVPPPPGFERQEWRARLSLAPHTRVAAHFGFVNRSKGVEVLIDAVARLVAGGCDLHLLMIGDPLGASDPTNEAVLRGIRQRIVAAGLEGRVHWTGYCPPDEVGAWLRCADVAVLPFLDGASPRRTSIQAAWANGTPVLTTHPGAGESWPVTPEPAATVPPGDAVAMAGALGDLLDSPQRRQALSVAGRVACRDSTWQAVTEATLDLYRAVLGSG